MLDAVLTANAEGSRYVLAVVNKDPQNAISLHIDFASMNKKEPHQLKGHVLSGRTADDYNDRGDEHVRPEEQTFRVRKSAVQIPAHSITFLTIE